MDLRIRILCIVFTFTSALASEVPQYMDVTTHYDSVVETKKTFTEETNLNKEGESRDGRAAIRIKTYPTAERIDPTATIVYGTPRLDATQTLPDLQRDRRKAMNNHHLSQSDLEILKLQSSLQNVRPSNSAKRNIQRANLVTEIRRKSLVQERNIPNRPSRNNVNRPIGPPPFNMVSSTRVSQPIYPEPQDPTIAKPQPPSSLFGGDPPAIPFGSPASQPGPPSFEGSGPPSISPPSSLFGPPSSFGPPSAGPPSVGAPAVFGPPGGPPSPPTVARPPSPLPPSISFTSPAPPTSGNSNTGFSEIGVTGASNIRCEYSSTRQSLTAELILPDTFDVVPVFEDKPRLDPTTDDECRFIPTNIEGDNKRVGNYQLFVSNFDQCGVRKCGNDGLLCLLLRFPRLKGIRLPEDQVVEIRCLPPKSLVEKMKTITVATTKNSGEQLSVFTSDPREFVCEIALYRKIPGTNMFGQRVTDDISLELGEEVQLRSKVRKDDGWNFSRIGKVIIQKPISEASRSLSDSTSVLVFTNGCKNDNLDVVALGHPRQAEGDSLENRFNFRVFMFQDMEKGESLMISANVIGCVEEKDCMTFCDQEIPIRQKREVQSSGLIGIGTSNRSRITQGTGYFVNKTETTNWNRNLAIKVRLPDEIPQKPVTYQECQLYLFVTLGVSLIFCATSVIFVVFTFFRSQRSMKKENRPMPILPPQQVQLITGVQQLPRIKKKSGKVNPPIMPNLETFNPDSHIEEIEVPATVRQRKREVNAEILSMFSNSPMAYTNQGYHPNIFDYFEYRMVPKQATVPKHIYDKRSMKQIKKEQHKRQLKHCQGAPYKDNSSCSCTNHNEQEGWENFNSDFTSVIHINGDYASTTPKCNDNKKEENIYTEVTTEPTMV